MSLASADRYATQGDLILVLNCGSSSIKFALFDAGRSPLPREPVWNGKVQGAAVRIDLPIWETQEARNGGDANGNASETEVSEAEEREEEGVIHGV